MSDIITSVELERWSVRWHDAITTAFLPWRVETSLQTVHLFEPLFICSVFVSQLSWSYTKNLVVAAVVAGTVTFAAAAKELRTRFDATASGTGGPTSPTQDSC